jgi:glycosyltransferase involved in cell wall biosynthesis
MNFKVTLLDMSRSPVDANASLQARYPEAPVEHVSKKDWKQLGPLGLLKATRRIRSDVFVIAVDDFASIQDETLLTLLGVMASAKQFLILEISSGNAKRVTRIGFIFLELPLSLLKLISTLLFTALFVIFIAGLRCLVWIRQVLIGQSYDLSGNLNRIAYLRTDMAFNIKAGGSITHTRGVIRGFKDNGKNILVLANEDAPWLTFEDIPVVVLRRTRLFSFFKETERMVSGIMFALRAIPKFREYQPEAIYQRQCPFDFSGLILSLWFKIPLVLESNNSDVMGTYWDRMRFRWICALVERTLMNGSSIIVTISEPLREILEELKYPSNRIHVLYNGVDINSFDTLSNRKNSEIIRTKLGIKKENILIGFVGTFGQWHGIPTLAEAIIESLNKNSNLYYILVGDGELKPDLVHKIQVAGCANKVICTGLIPAEEIGNYLAACDILLSPHSTSPDGKKFFGSPTKLFEYMAANRAIIASDLDQIGEILLDGVTALLVEPNNSSELASTICRLATDEDKRLFLGRQAREEVKKKYTWKMNVGQVLALMNRS